MQAPWSFWQRCQVKDWSQRVITYSTTISIFEKGVPIACRSLELLADMQVKDWS